MMGGFGLKLASDSFAVNDGFEKGYDDDDDDDDDIWAEKA